MIQAGITDRMLAAMYDRFDREKILPLLFYENPLMTIYEFIGLYRLKATNTIGCYMVDSLTQKLEPIGLMWTNEVTSIGSFKRANSGMSFYRGQPSHRLVRFAHMGIEWAFDRIGLNALHGITPDKNRAALLFSRKCGFELVGPMRGVTLWEGELADAWFSSMLKSRWAEIRPWRNNGNR